MSAPVVAVVANKGGVGKTVTAANLAAVCAGYTGLRVLLFDCDPQADLTSDFGVAPDGDTLAEVLEAMSRGEPFPPGAIYATGTEQISIVPGGEGLNELKRDLAAAGDAGEDWVAQAFRSAPGDWDLVIVDTPVGFEPTTVGGLIAADLALIVVSAQDVRSLVAVRATLGVLEQLDDRARGAAGLVITRSDARMRGERRASQWIRGALGEGADGQPLYGDVPILGEIPETASMHVSAFMARPVYFDEPDSRAGTHLLRLGTAVLNAIADGRVNHG